MKSKRMSYNAITELRGVKRIVGGGIRKERKARRNSERGRRQAEGGGMFANKPGSPPKVFSVGFNRGPRKVPQRGVPAESIFGGVKVRTLCGVQWRRRLAAQAVKKFTRMYKGAGRGGIRKEREARRNSEDVRRKVCGAEISSRYRGSTIDVRGATLPPNNSHQPRVAKPSSPAMENPTHRVGFCWRTGSRCV